VDTAYSPLGSRATAAKWLEIRQNLAAGKKIKISGPVSPRLCDSPGSEFPWWSESVYGWSLKIA
jgi:hypothetical protein